MPAALAMMLLPRAIANCMRALYLRRNRAFFGLFFIKWVKIVKISSKEEGPAPLGLDEHLGACGRDAK